MRPISKLLMVRYRDRERGGGARRRFRGPRPRSAASITWCVKLPRRARSGGDRRARGSPTPSSRANAASAVMFRWCWCAIAASTASRTRSARPITMPMGEAGDAGSERRAVVRQQQSAALLAVEQHGARDRVSVERSRRRRGGSRALRCGRPDECPGPGPPVGERDSHSVDPALLGRLGAASSAACGTRTVSVAVGGRGAVRTRLARNQRNQRRTNVRHTR